MQILTSQDYERELRNCTRCSSLLSNKPVDPANSTEMVRPRPIVRPLAARSNADWTGTRLQRIAAARKSICRGEGVAIDDVDFESP